MFLLQLGRTACEHTCARLYGRARDRLSGSPASSRVVSTNCVCETFAALKGKCDVKNMRQGWMAELKPAVNTNALLPVCVSVCYRLSLSFCLCSSLVLSFSDTTWRGQRQWEQQCSQKCVCYLCSRVRKDSQIDRTLLDQVQLETDNTQLPALLQTHDSADLCLCFPDKYLLLLCE